VRAVRLHTLAIALFALTLVMGPAVLLAEQRIAGDEPPNAGLALVPLLEDLAEGDLEERISAAYAIRELGASARLAAPLLVQALDDPSVGMRKAAAGALGGIGPDAAEAVIPLAALLEDGYRFVRSWAAMALYEIGPSARPATEGLIGLLANDRENLRGRSWAASALAEIEADPELAVPALIHALRNDKSVEVRLVAVIGLERYAEEAARRGGSDALIAALDDPEPNVRRNAACALPKMGRDAARGLSMLTPVLRDAAPDVRRCAERARDQLEELAAID
jgi:HEAT repeat protein